ncbi:sulfatase [Galbibacter sp. BG1]|uniref:sulfatase family protein n=1 Tax=Galbibacter sp. BG1 TaxID=1170699 RepID=UPI0015BC4836|nr:sulfatase [Galbibacter sp. BG1]QLE01718.1 sulfatase [Galbibacter sp. BG1]
MSRWFQVLTLQTLLLFITISCAKKQENIIDQLPKKPNVLFAIADDATWKHFGAYGCNWVKTPNFDRVAKNGLLFMRAYTPNAKCAPSRSCIITGRNSWQLEAAANHSPNFPEKFKSYVEVLDSSGYSVGYTGKGWAPGNPGIKNGEERMLTGKPYNQYKTEPPTTHISSTDYAKNFETFLEDKPKGEAFCFWFGALEPHRSYEFGSGVEKGRKKINAIQEVPLFWPDVDTVRVDMLDYAFEIEYFDTQLGKMLETLQERDELDNTIVVVTADNGMPFPRAKGQSYEYSNHMPLAIMWPNGIKQKGRKVLDLVSFIDFAPTFLEVAGIAHGDSGMAPITGKSLTEFFYSEKDSIVNSKRDYALLGKERHDVGRPNDLGYPIRGIIKGDYLYLKNLKPDRWPAGNPQTGYLNVDGSPTKTYILNTRRNNSPKKYWQFNFGKRVEEELFNITKDPYCMNNLATNKSYDSIKTALGLNLMKKLTEQKDPRVLGDEFIFEEYEYFGKVNNFYNRYLAGEEIQTSWVNKTDFEPNFNEEDE